MTVSEPVFVTGATGFLGSHYCRMLDERGVDVHALRRPSSDVSSLDGCDVEWHVGDVLQPATLRPALAECNSVVHLAGIGLAAAGPETVHRVNVEGTENVLEAAYDGGVEKLLFASTAGTRRSSGVADETDVAEPIGAYQESKAQAETLVDGYHDRGLDVVTVHPTSVFGPRDLEFTARLLSLALDPKMIASLPGGLSFVGVDDAVAGIHATLDRGRSGDHYVLGGENLRFREAVSVISEIVGGSGTLLEVPGLALRALGHVAGASDTYAGVRFFPFTPAMARLATSELFYSSAKAARELGYDYRPLREHVPPALDWYRSLA